MERPRLIEKMNTWEDQPLTNEKDEIEVFDQLQIDALREFGSIGALHASNALASLVGKDVMIDVSECLICRVEDIGQNFENVEESVVSVFLDAYGNERGSILLIFSMEMTRALSELMIDKPNDSDRSIDEDDIEVVAEIGNICASAYLNAISQLLGIVMLPSPPGVAVDMLGAILTFPASLVAEFSEYLVLIKTQFIFEGQAYPGSILYFPDLESQSRLMNYFNIE